MRYTLPFSTVVMLAGAPVLAEGVALSDGIDLTGAVEMGIASGPRDSDPTETRTRLLLDLDARVTASRELDNGLTIGVEFDLPELTED